MFQAGAIADFRARSPFLFRLFVWAASTFAAALVGPFSTYISFNLVERLIYWGSLIAVAMGMGYSIRAVLQRVFGHGGLTVDLVGALVQSVALGLVIWLANLHVYGFAVAGAGWALYHIAIALVICSLVMLVRDQMRRTSSAPGRGEAAAPPEATGTADTYPRPAFLQRLEEPLAGRLTRVSADDHYLQVFTPVGRGRVLMRFRDALADLEALPGYRIHRSHWVAEEVLVRVRVEGRRHVADLRCGTVLPVSKAHLDRLREAGFLD